MNRDEQTVRRFIQERGPAIHPSLGAPSRFNEERMVFESLEAQPGGAGDSWGETSTLADTTIDDGAEQERKSFKEKLNELSEAKVIDFELDPEKCEWEDVIIELERVTKAANACGSHEGLRGYIRKKYERLYGIAEVFVPTLNAIPDEAFLIHAGLAALFSVYHLRQPESRSNEQLTSHAGHSQPPGEQGVDPRGVQPPPRYR